MQNKIMLLLLVTFIATPVYAAKTTLETVAHEITFTVDNQVFVEEIQEYWQVIDATPKSGGSRYVRLQNRAGESWIWNAPLNDYNTNVSMDPEVETRWLRE